MNNITGSHQYLFLIILLFGLFSNIHSNPQTNFLTQKNQTQDVWITVFVHGIISIKPHVPVTNFIRFLTDDVKESFYAETVDIIRQTPFFFQNQAIQEEGLQPINLNNHQKGAAASLMANVFEQTRQIHNTQPNTQNYYYTYGWSGLLSRSARYEDAKKFLNALEQEIAQYRAQGINPKVRLIGYSHGGTVILKLALVKRSEHITPSFAVDELLLFGTPIQFDTDYLIDDPFFKQIYNIFSGSDRVQKLDFFSCGQFFSSQEFRPHYGFEKLPNKLVQIQIRIIRKKGDACKPLSPCDIQLPLLYDGKKCTRTIRNVSPGHTELWFFGWTPMNYRKTFPLYPIPIVAFTPFLINTITPFKQNFKPEKPITITIDPRRNSMIINNNLCTPQVYALPFIGIEKFLELRQVALSYRPDPALYNRETFNEQIDHAYEQAWKNLNAKKCEKHSKPAQCE